ncbi:MAG: TlpA family protein disulfide reductase [Chloroflexi bacterium]|nr:TlpA family protein disulfide reductase [Chloroflexota bacterium]
MSLRLKQGLLFGGFFLLLVMVPFLGFHDEHEDAIISAQADVTQSTFPIQSFELVDLEGERTTIDEYFGQPMVINFFATWCGPCEAEMPMFEEYADQLQGEVTFIGINSGESSKDVSAFVKRIGVTFGVYLDSDNQIVRQFLVRALPTTLFIDRDGALAAKHIGILTPELMDGYLEEIGIDQ